MLFVKTKELESYLLNINSEFFAFSYALVPEELQAQQIVLDSVSAVLLNFRSEIADLVIDEKCQGEDSLKTDLFFLRIKRETYRQIFVLAGKRSSHFKNSMDVESDFLMFSQLQLIHRAVLFLRYKTSISMHEIEEILGKSKTQLIGLLSEGQDLLAKKILDKNPNSFRNMEFSN